MLRAGVIEGIQFLPLPYNIHQHHAVCNMGGGLHAVGQAAGNIRLHHQAVHHDLNIMLFVLVQLDLFRQVINGAVNARTHKAGLAGVVQFLNILALVPSHNGRHNLNFRFLRQGENLIHDLIHRLLGDLAPAYRAMGNTDPCPQQSQVVIDLRYRAHSGARVAGGGLLVNGYGRGQTLDIVHIRLLHLTQELTGIRGQALHIPTLTFGINGVKSQAGLAGAGQAGKHHQLVPGNLYINILQVVLAGTFYHNVLYHFSLRSPSCSSF